MCMASIPNGSDKGFATKIEHSCEGEPKVYLMHWACRDNFEEGKPAKIRKLKEEAAEQLAVRKLVEEQVVLQAAVRRLGATCKARAKTTAKPSRTPPYPCSESTDGECSSPSEAAESDSVEARS